MVATRRTAKAPAASGSQPPPAAAPAAAAATTSGSDEAGPSGSLAEHYRQQYRREREEESSTAFRRVKRRARLLWFQLSISLGPFMLDPWEQALYFSCIALMLWMLAVAVSRGPLWSGAAGGWGHAVASLRALLLPAP